jgi:voltage-gated potassium channel
MTMHAGPNSLPPLPAGPGGYGRPPGNGLRARLYRVIFESDTRAGRMFDLGLIVAILVSVLVVVLDSVQELSMRHGRLFDALEWSFTVLFSVEYLLRLYCVRRPLAYAKSFFGLIDFVSVVPTYLAMLMPGAQLLLDVRILRLLRIFRILKLTTYVDEYRMLGAALLASRRKILIFLSVVLMAVLLLATVMYAVEGPANGFTSIPTALYWAITAVTTVGFGDIVPKTDLGRAISAIIMLLGWGILAVPTGIISSELSAQRGLRRESRRCAACGSDGHAAEAKYCKDCGARLETGSDG